METTNLVDIESRFILAQESRNLSPYTIRNYRQFFIELHRYEQERGVCFRGDSLTNDILRDVAVWLRQAPLRKPRNGRTTRNSGGLLVRLRQLRALVRWLQAEGLTNPSLFVKLPSVPQQIRESLTEAQVGKLWESTYLTGQSAQSARNRALLALMLTSGLRVAEVAGIEDRDFSWDDGIVVVTGKGDKERYVPVSRETEALIRGCVGGMRSRSRSVVRGGARRSSLRAPASKSSAARSAGTLGSSSVPTGYDTQWPFRTSGRGWIRSTSSGSWGTSTSRQPWCT